MVRLSALTKSVVWSPCLAKTGDGRSAASASEFLTGKRQLLRRARELVRPLHFCTSSILSLPVILQSGFHPGSRLDAAVDFGDDVGQRDRGARGGVVALFEDEVSHLGFEIPVDDRERG